MGSPSLVELFAVALPLRDAWRSAHGSMAERRSILIRVERDGIVGWGECPALAVPEPGGQSHVDAWASLRDDVIPRWLATGHLETSLGHRMAAAGLGSALADLDLRTGGRSLRERLGATRSSVPSGIAIGLQPSLDVLHAAVDRAVADGYQRVKVKVEPGRDAPWVASLRRAYPELALWVDANGSFDPGRAEHRLALRDLDGLGLGLIEQPLRADDLTGHIELARRLDTPICLDEPLVSLAATIEAVERGACSVVNLKPARVGGWDEAERICDWCAAHGVDLWVGGLVESGVGRAANVAFAATDAATLVGDLSPSSRFFEVDVVTPGIELRAGHLAVPTGVGIGVEVDVDAVERLTAMHLHVT